MQFCPSRDRDFYPLSLVWLCEPSGPRTVNTPDSSRDLESALASRFPLLYTTLRVFTSLLNAKRPSSSQHSFLASCHTVREEIINPQKRDPNQPQDNCMISVPFPHFICEATYFFFSGLEVMSLHVCVVCYVCWVLCYLQGD